MTEYDYPLVDLYSETETKLPLQAMKMSTVLMHDYLGLVESQEIAPQQAILDFPDWNFCRQHRLALVSGPVLLYWAKYWHYAHLVMKL